MIRKLAIALSLLGACFTGLVHALGLGEVTVQSALNQPLSAEIELVNTAGLTIDEILPGLATREEFQKANVDRVYFLSDLRFEVQTNSKGKAVVILTSKKPVREPFLNFIVELIWPSGRLLREYALLIDPPLFSDQPVAQVNTAPTVKRVSTGDTLDVGSANTSSVTKRPILAPVNNKIESGSYGPTNANDTLWDIAIQARPDRSVSPQQVMLAIQDLNPNAFIDDNINKLKAGQVLRLPSVDQIKQRSQHQAIQGVIAQNEALSGKRTQSVAQGSEATSQTANKPSRSVKVAGGDELKLVVPEVNKASTTNSANAGQSEQTSSGNDTALAIALEKLDKTSIENSELNSRLGDLEEQLSTLQRLLTLKNDQLSAIQSQMRANELEKLQASSTQEVTSSESVELETQEGVVSNETETLADNTAMPNKTQAESKAEEGAEVVQEEVVQENETTKDAAPVASLIEEPQVANAAESAKDNEPAASQNIIQIILNNPLYLAISIASIFILVFLLWLVSRHNAKREEEFQAQNALSNDEEFDEVNVFDEHSDEVSEEYSEDELDQEDGSFATDESGSQFTDELQEETQDILAEVNAYISYGRLDQAAQVLEKSISQDPVRTDYRLALLGVYKDLGDRQAFDRQFSELEAIQDQEALVAAEQIRKDLQEEESLAFDADDNDFGLGGGASAQTQPVQEPAVSKANNEQQEEDLPEELKSFDFDSVSLEEESEDEELDLTSELDLDSLEIDESADEGLLDESVDEFASLSNEPADESLDLSDESLELADELSLDETSMENTDLEAEVESDDFDDSILDVDLDDLDLNAELDQESEIALTSDFDGSINKEADELVVSDDVLEEAAQAFDSESVDSLDDDLSDADEFDFLNGTDEASTKLDLARAYIDMGDVEGAKDILLEVTKEGSESQQAEAKDLLDSID